VGFNLLARDNQTKLSQVEVVTKSAWQRSDRFHSPVARVDCNLRARDLRKLAFEFPGCRRESVLARGLCWPPESRLRLRRPRPPGRGEVGSPLHIGVWAEWDRSGVFGGEEEAGGVRSG
jgi:hypothetical protein